MRYRSYDSKALAALSDRLAAERLQQQSLISLQEQSRSAVLTLMQDRVVGSQPASTLRTLGLELSLERVGGDVRSRLVAGSQVGTIRLISGKEFVDVIVEPKVGSVAFLQMLEFCHGAVSLESRAAAYHAKNPAPCFVIDLVVSHIERFLRGKTHRDYSLKWDAASPRPRGRLDIASYASRQLPSGRPHLLPCAFFDFSNNVFENQVLASTLQIAGRLAASFPPDLRQAIARKIARTRQYLSGVEVRRISASELDAHVYTKQAAAYQPLHDICKIVLFGGSVSLTPGRQLTFMSFSLNMANLFERYVRTLFRRAYGTKIVPHKRTLHYPLHGTTSGSIVLDAYVKTDPSWVIECKYKIVETSANMDFDEGRMVNADIYQVAAYSVHRDVSAGQALIVYPTLRVSRSPVEIAATIRSFRGHSGHVIPIRVMLIDLAVPPHQLLKALILFLRREPPPWRLPA